MFNLPKHWWKPFRATTPGGVKFGGLLCQHRKAGPLAGALFVNTVNGRETSQLLMGMPEIPYAEQKPLQPSRAHERAVFVDKLDGTAVIFNLLDVGGEGELLPRTRGVPVLFNNVYRPWRDMVNRLADHDALEEACARHRATLVFEMYGAENRHAVDYRGLPLRLALHTMLCNRRICPRHTIDLVADNYGFHAAPTVAVCPPNVAQIDATAQRLMQEYERQNDVARGQFLREGVILVIERAGSARLLKYKPPSMTEYHRISRRKPKSIAVRHLFFKLLEVHAEATLDVAFDAALEEFGGDLEDYGFFEQEFHAWRALMEKEHREGRAQE